jgi:hypothetical protein
MFEIKSIPGVKKFENVISKLKTNPNKDYTVRGLDNIIGVALHQSMTKSGSAYNYANYHVNTHDWPGIGYDFVIEKDGTLRWCNYLEYMNYHVGNSNYKYIGICFTGDFRVKNGKPVQEPTKEQIETVYYLLKFLFDLKQELPNLKHIKGHNECPGYSWKECPGFNMNEFRKDYSKFLVSLEKPAFISSEHFVDVPKGSWYEECCEALYDLGLLNGEKTDKETGKQYLGVGNFVDIERAAALQYKMYKFIMDKHVKPLEKEIEKLKSQLK